MALKHKSLINYGLQIDQTNSSIDFKSSSGGPVFQASVPFGNYTLTGLAAAVGAAMGSADSLNTYTVTVDRTVSSGTQNRITIFTSGSFLSLLFGTGPRAASTIAPEIGFTSADHTGSTSYTGTSTAGTILIPDYVGYSYLGPDFIRMVFGALNISARGDKEALVWSVQKFFQVEFRFEPEAKVIVQWQPLMTWAIQQKPMEFTPDITVPTTFYECTLESTDAEGKGLGYKMTEMLPDFPFNYRTGMLKFRQKVG